MLYVTLSITQVLDNISWPYLNDLHSVKYGVLIKVNEQDFISCCLNNFYKQFDKVELMECRTQQNISTFPHHMTFGAGPFMMADTMRATYNHIMKTKNLHLKCPPYQRHKWIKYLTYLLQILPADSQYLSPSTGHSFIHQTYIEAEKFNDFLHTDLNSVP